MRSLTLIIAAMIVVAGAASAAPGGALHAGNPKDLWVIQYDGKAPAEMVLAETLQGLPADNKDRKIWIKAPGGYQVILDQMIREGVRTHEVKSVWELVREFNIKRAIVYKLGAESLNVAASLCGPMNCVAIDESMIDRAKYEGLEIVKDVRGEDEKTAFDKYRSLFTHGMVIDERVGKPTYLRDLAVARHAFVFGVDDPAFRTRVVKALGPRTLALGWGIGESRWVRAVTLGGGTAVPADLCLNLSVLELLPARQLDPPVREPVKAQEGKRYIAFVTTDGDNIQMLCGCFPLGELFWGSPLRGKVKLTWEVSPVLAEVAPRVLEYYYSTATPNDDFVTGAGAPGYTFLHFQPDPGATAEQASGYLKKSGLHVASTLNSQAGKLSEAISLLERPEVSGVLYKDYARYNLHKGEIFWHKGKPCLAYKFVLWQGQTGPEQLSGEIAKMPTSPMSDENSYALVNVHAWSYRTEGGMLPALKRAIDLLPPNTEVVSANQLIGMLIENFGKKHAAD